MSTQDEGGRQPNDGSDKTDEQMDQDLDQGAIDAVRDEAARKMLSSTAAQKKHWRDKAKALESELAKAKQGPPKEEPKPAPKPSSFDPEAYKAELKEEFSLQQKHPDLDDADLKRARALAQADGRKLSEVIEDGFFQSYLTDKRAKQAAARASADPSNRSGQPGSKDWSRVEADPSLVRGMSSDDLKAFYAWQKAKGRK